ncbi:MAG: transposase, partial [Gemmatimonadota bacterium]
QERFADEEACREYLFASRWPEGFRCRRCSSSEVGVMHRRRLVFQCKGCDAQTSVTVGTAASYCSSRSKGFGWGGDVDGVGDPLAAGPLDVRPEWDA